MRLATLGPTDAGDAVVRDNRRSVDDQISYGVIWDHVVSCWCHRPHKGSDRRRLCPRQPQLAWRHAQPRPRGATPASPHRRCWPSPRGGPATWLQLLSDGLDKRGVTPACCCQPKGPRELTRHGGRSAPSPTSSSARRAPRPSRSAGSAASPASSTSRASFPGTFTARRAIPPVRAIAWPAFRTARRDRRPSRAAACWRAEGAGALPDDGAREARLPRDRGGPGRRRQRSLGRVRLLHSGRRHCEHLCLFGHQSGSVLGRSSDGLNKHAPAGCTKWTH
jgi:hypothetical protein